MTEENDSKPTRAVEATLEDFLDALDLLNEEELLELAAAWESADAAAREDAWTRAMACAAVNGLTAETDKVRAVVMNWAVRGTNVPWPYGAMEDMHRQIRRQAGRPLVDAAVAILLGAHLDGAARSVLLGPWAGVGSEP